MRIFCYAEFHPPPVLPTTKRLGKKSELAVKGENFGSK